MKKLLITSALVAGFASSAFAHAGPTVTLGGSLDTQLGVRSQKSGYDTDAPNVTPATTQNKFHKFAIANDTKLHVKADGKAGNGLKYGGMIEITTDTSNDKYNHNTFNSNGKKTSAYVESMFGRLEAGSTTGVVDAMSVSGASVARATGGIAGDARYWWNPYIFKDNAGTATANDRLVSTNFIVNPTLPSNYDAGGEANSAKVNYMTPTYAGFKAGVTYMPDIEQHGSASMSHVVLKNANTNNNPFSSTADSTLGFKNVWSGGLHYAGKMSNVGLKASLLGETGDAKNTTLAGTNPVGTRHDLRAWTLGGSMNVMGFTLAASYGDWGKSGVAKAATTAGKKKSHFWTVGGSYEYGAMGASVTYMESKRGGTASVATVTKAKEHRNVSLGMDYKLAPGFMPYAEVSFFKLDEKNSTASGHNRKNDGSVFLAGTKLSF